jgi:hypothetical protein
MTDLDTVENDADGTFWYDPVGNPVQPCSGDPPPTKHSSDKKHWIEIVLYDVKGHPVPGHAYRIQLPDGSVVTGNLDSRGSARVNGIDPGTCKVTFPELDKTSWNRQA